MADQAAAVLVVPAEGDPGGLLAPVVLGGRPPRLRRYPLRGPDAPWEACHDAPGGLRAGEYALPLWWDGALVPEGWDRAVRALPPAEVVGAGVSFHLRPTFFQTEQAARRLVSSGLASRVVRLARVDGRLVEVSP